MHTKYHFVHISNIASITMDPLLLPKSRVFFRNRVCIYATFFCTPLQKLLVIKTHTREKSTSIHSYGWVFLNLMEQKIETLFLSRKNRAMTHCPLFFAVFLDRVFFFERHSAVERDICLVLLLVEFHSKNISQHFPTIQYPTFGMSYF